jgi:hypothetical protein
VRVAHAITGLMLAVPFTTLIAATEQAHPGLDELDARIARSTLRDKPTPYPTEQPDWGDP